MHLNSRLLFIKHVKPLLKSGMKVLEIGPNDFPSTYERVAETKVSVWHTLDICNDDRLTYPRSAEYSFNIPDETYDIVLSGNVIEHVRKPWLWLRELARVTANDGLVVTICPINWPYHKVPVDCWRIYPEGMCALHEEAGLLTVLALSDSLDTLDGVVIPPQPRRGADFPKKVQDTIAIGRKLSR